MMAIISQDAVMSKFQTPVGSEILFSAAPGVLNLSSLSTIHDQMMAHNSDMTIEQADAATQSLLGLNANVTDNFIDKLNDAELSDAQKIPYKKTNGSHTYSARILVII